MSVNLKTMEIFRSMFRRDVSDRRDDDKIVVSFALKIRKDSVNKIIYEIFNNDDDKEIIIETSSLDGKGRTTSFDELFETIPFPSGCNHMTDLLSQIYDEFIDKIFNRISKIHESFNVCDYCEKTCVFSDHIDNFYNYCYGCLRIYLEQQLMEIERDCCICCDDDSSTFHIICDLKCGHSFHFKCLKKMEHLKNNKCPLCRKVFILDNEMPSEARTIS